MTPGHTLASAVLRQVLHAAATTPTPSPAPGSPIPDLPALPVGLNVPPERTGQIVAAALAIVLDVAGLAAVGIGSLIARYRRTA